jgi:hypothetical protein
VTTPSFETFLAKLYVDREARAEFLADPRGTAGRAGLSEVECEALVAIDRTGLEMAAVSFEHKRRGGAGFSRCSRRQGSPSPRTG